MMACICGAAFGQSNMYGFYKCSWCGRIYGLSEDGWSYQGKEEIE